MQPAAYSLACAALLVTAELGVSMPSRRTVSCPTQSHPPTHPPIPSSPDHSWKKKRGWGGAMFWCVQSRLGWLVCAGTGRSTGTGMVRWRQSARRGPCGWCQYSWSSLQEQNKTQKTEQILVTECTELNHRNGDILLWLSKMRNT